VRIRLGKEDRERLGAPEWLEWPPRGLFQVEAELLQETLEVEPDEYVQWVRGTPVLDNDGEPVEEDGVVKRHYPAKALRFRVWQALRRAGVNVPFASVDFDRADLEFDGDDPEPAAEPGKADPPSDPTTTSDSDG
jgi:hypothetical protein